MSLHCINQAPSLYSGCLCTREAVSHKFAGLDLAKFLVEECYAFLGELKEKLDGLDETVFAGTAVQTSNRKRQKVVDPNRKKRVLVPFNLFVKQVGVLFKAALSRISALFGRTHNRGVIPGNSKGKG